MPLKVKIDKEFRPALQYKTLYYIYFILIILVPILPIYMPIMIFAPVIIRLLVPPIVLAVLIFTTYWIHKYYDTVIYKLTNNEMVWRRGVWFRKTGIVPYNRITNVDISQGPISRVLGIASLHIQTAGYSGQNKGFGDSAEIKIEGVENSEEVREVIMNFVRGRKPVAVATYEDVNINSKVINELIKIRKLLERPKKR
ncbi:MAG: PH domain-containing protein [Candidatus Aenigmarchaeota archaeon]|nr:PH domain-containing protein [Candidatus Aenigmarchaeota archaeon]